MRTDAVFTPHRVRPDKSDGSRDGNDDQPQDTVRGRVDESRWKLGLLMDAHRWVVATGVLTTVFLSLTAFSLVDLPRSD